jgi:hypothetical protein
MGDYKQEFLELAENLNDEEWDIKVNSGWTIKDIVSHFIAWEEEFAVCLKDSWQNNEKPWFLKTNNFNDFNKAAVKKYKNYNARELIERWKFVIRVLDFEIDNIGIGRIKAKGELFDWIFDDSHYQKYLNQAKKVIGISKISDLRTNQKNEF